MIVYGEAIGPLSQTLPLQATWLLNQNIAEAYYKLTTEINFVSNGQNFSKFIIGWDDIKGTNFIQYDTTIVLDIGHRWVNENYRTVTFETKPTGELLTWLQANGTKQ